MKIKHFLSRILSPLMTVSLLLAYSAGAAPRKIDFKYASNQDYKSSVEKLRQQMTLPISALKNVRQTSLSSDLTLVSFPASGTDVNLVMSDRDLYVVGFTTQGTFYRLSDAAFAKSTIAGYKTSPLKLSPHYRELERISRSTRARTVINSGTLQKAVKTFGDYRPGKTQDAQLASAVMTMAIGVSESMRFENILSQIHNQWSTGQALGEPLANQTNDWSAISAYANVLATQPRASEPLVRKGASPITRQNIASTLSVALNCSAKRVSFLNASPMDQVCSGASPIALVNGNYVIK